MFARVFAAGLLALLATTACQRGPSAPAAPVTGDSFLGPADARVTVVEYGAPTCPACKSWHDQYWAELKADYIDTGKIKFVFRELPSHNPPVDAAIFAIARCSGQENFFNVIDKAFEDQQQIEMASQRGQARETLAELASGFGFSTERFEACIRDPANRQRIFDMQADADRRGVTGTPTFFVNDVMVDDPRMPAFGRQIDAALAAAGGQAGGAAPAPAPPAQPAP
jgi:protein-disulfide isomerase